MTSLGEKPITSGAPWGDSWKHHRRIRVEEDRVEEDRVKEDKEIRREHGAREHPGPPILSGGARVSQKFIDKARTLPVDQVFLDLEDACAPLAKPAPARPSWPR